MLIASDDMMTTSQRNMTSLVDAKVTLQCPLAAARRVSSRIRWQKHDDDGAWQRLFLRDSGRVRVGPAGGLEIDRLLVSDAGLYRCLKTTIRRVDVYSVPVALTVHGM